MLKNSLNKLIAVASAITMTIAAFSPMASAMTLSSPIKADGVTVVKASDLGAKDGVLSTSSANSMVTKSADLVTAISGTQNLSFSMTVNTPLKDGCYQNGTNGVSGDARKTLDSFALRFDNGSDPSGALHAKLYDAANNTMSFCWKAGNDTAGTFFGPDGSTGEFQAKIGETYNYVFAFQDIGLEKNKGTVDLYIYDSTGTLVSKTVGMDMRALYTKGKTVTSVYYQNFARVDGEETSVTISDMVKYTKLGPDELTVTATGVKTADGEGQDIELNGKSNKTMIVEPVGGDIKLSGVVSKEGTEDKAYTVSYALEKADEGIEIDGDTIKVTSKAAGGELKATLIAYPVTAAGDVKTDSYIKMPLTIEKPDTPITDYAKLVKDNLKLLDADGKEITPTGSVYKFEKAFTPVTGDKRVTITWSCKEKDDSNEWVDSDIIDVTTGKYTPKEGYTKEVKLIATFTSDEDESIELVKEFICKPADSEVEAENDAAWLVDYMKNAVDDPDAVSENIKLPTTGSYGSSITWTSSAPSIISTKGKVVRQTTNKKVTLTATIEKGNQTKEETFEYTVKKKLTSGSNGSGGTSGSSSHISGVGVVTKPSATPVPTVAPTQAPAKQEFTDLGSVEWAKEAINALSERSVVNGKTATEFAPNDDITRAEFAKILINAFGLVTPNSTVTALSDVTDSSAWYYEAIASAYNKGIITGYSDGSFGINDKVTREDMAVMVYRAAQYAKVNINVMKPETNFADANEISGYAVEAVNALQRAGVINGVSDTEFAPKATATRAQAAKMVYGLTK